MVGFELTPLSICDDYINYAQYAFSFDALTNYVKLNVEVIDLVVSSGQVDYYQTVINSGQRAKMDKKGFLSFILGLELVGSQAHLVNLRTVLDRLCKTVDNG